MSADHDDRLTRFLGTLRNESEDGPGRGFGRFARSIMAQRGSTTKLSERDFHRIEILVARLGELVAENKVRLKEGEAMCLPLHRL